MGGRSLVDNAAIPDKEALSDAASAGASRPVH